MLILQQVRQAEHPDGQVGSIPGAIQLLPHVTRRFCAGETGELSH